LILVTGGAGYVGSHCTKELLRRGYEVVVLDNLSTGYRAAVQSEHFVKADLLDREAIDRAFAEHSIDAVMHFAGLIRVGESVDDPQIYYQNNVLGTLNLLESESRSTIHRSITKTTSSVPSISFRQCKSMV
jgi:UDP-glucose 4-epimerase